MENRSRHSKSRHKGVLNMMTSIVLVILASGIPRNVFAIQSWSEQPIYHEVNPGGQVVMPCIVLNKRGECRWEKDAQPVGIHPGKYEWAATTKGSSPDPGGVFFRLSRSPDATSMVSIALSTLVFGTERKKFVKSNYNRK